MRQMTPIVKNIIIANVLVFLAQYLFKDQGFLVERYGALFPLGTP